MCDGFSVQENVLNYTEDTCVGILVIQLSLRYWRNSLNVEEISDFCVRT